MYIYIFTYVIQVIASRVHPTIQMLVSEANGDLTGHHIETPPKDIDPLQIQIWVDKDGRVSFIKIKLIDTSYRVFKSGQSRVAYLLEYIGDEGECRRFLPPLVDQFAETNEELFSLPNRILIRAKLVFVSGDHKALWALTGRGGGNVRRDLFCKSSLTHYFHKVLHQGPIGFKYSEFIKSWTSVSEDMDQFRRGRQLQNKPMTKEMERRHIEKLYRQYGRIDRMPGFTYGTKYAVPSVTDQLLVTPLNLHNDTFSNLLNLELMFMITDKGHPDLRKLRGCWKGLIDGFGQTKCSTSGEGIRRLVNDCLVLADATIPSHRKKYACLWWLKDTISYHLRLTQRGEHGPLALEDYEQLKFAACSLLWWLLIGDLSADRGKHPVYLTHIQF